MKKERKVRVDRTVVSSSQAKSQQPSKVWCDRDWAGRGEASLVSATKQKLSGEKGRLELTFPVPGPTNKCYLQQTKAYLLSA